MLEGKREDCDSTTNESQVQRLWDLNVKEEITLKITQVKMC